ncbi:MAG: hypothetical protein NWQ54_07285 [Paraglaciecola sp.]|nr:hypothetical protein [Paraglaciecola sp.]
MVKRRFIVSHCSSIVFFFALSACSSTTSQTADPIINQTTQAEITDKTLSPFQFNQGLQQDLNNNNSAGLQSKIDVLSIAKQLRNIQSTQFSNPLVTAKTAADLKQQLVSGMLELSTSFTWRYLHSEEKADNKLAAYYRIESEGGYSYVTFWLEQDSYKIYDFHPVSFYYSALDFVGEFTQLFSKYSHKQGQLSNLILAIQKNQWDKTISLYQAIDADIKAEPALNDFLLRKYSQMQGDNPQFTNVLMSAFEQQGLSSLLFESLYIQQDNFNQAIKMVEGLPQYARQDSKMLSELAILHAYNQDFRSAILFGRQSIMAGPNENEAYIVLLQVSLLAKDYALSIELMDVLSSKFNFLMGQGVIAEFDESDTFLRSDEYKLWLEKHSTNKS